MEKIASVKGNNRLGRSVLTTSEVLFLSRDLSIFILSDQGTKPVTEFKK